MQFLFHTLSLTSSGGSRVVCDLASYLCEQGHDVTIVLDRNRIAFPLNPKVKVLLLKEYKLKDITPLYSGDTQAFQKHSDKKNKKTKKQKLRHKYKLIDSINEWKKYLLKILTYPSKKIAIKKLIEEINPDLVISHNMYYFLEHYLFYKGRNFCVVLHNSPNQVFIDRTVKTLLPLSYYYNETHCIGVSKGVSQEMLELFPKATVSTVYNPVDLDNIKALSTCEIPKSFIDKKYIVTVSSLAPGKRIDRTIKAFNQLQDDNINLVILGEGEEKASLMKLVDELGISHRVEFLGFIENPKPYMKHAQMLSFTSDYEGLGLVLVEALACGTPVLSTNCPSGPDEVLTGPLKQYLIEIKGRSEKDIVNDIAVTMKNILESPPKIMPNQIAQFSKERIVSSWESIAKRSNHGDKRKSYEIS
ncbi:glycosyltransferase [Vibrio vulnificus]|nr:glycosyltransferase [Vibrio vulnificus]EHH0683298.1 glycosyltransferase [Vibrio vulnificus]EHH0709332.1 glycosyltransferase [Vibrio vulnificus]EHH1186136.1 glycosyltransferase [Vibrio vulnificus]EHH2479420.1 glycosyltransferase [Vibrio vulnificus]